ncbi:MAG TPA: class I SAM-dependent methyltransferase, partial [Hyphomicrobiaceae bacterium]|nr:class I SAM-dependent methyltransferase [Hyphomicrobiaceae bacterium]
MYETDRYADQNPSWHEEDAPWKAKHIENIIKKNVPSFQSICEVGCGTGEILLSLEKAFPQAHLYGYEVAPHAHQRAKLKETESVEFHFGDIVKEEQ